MSGRRFTPDRFTADPVTEALTRGLSRFPPAVTRSASGMRPLSGHAATERATGRRMPWLGDGPRPRCPLGMATYAGPTVVDYDCDRAEGHKGAWHHDPRGYWWLPSNAYPGAEATVNRCATPSHVHTWEQPWASHVPAAVTVPAHRAGRRKPAWAGTTSKPARGC